MITDFGAVIEQVNSRFGSRFRSFDHTAANVRTCFRVIEEKNRRKYGGGVVDEASIARPSRQRGAIAASVRRRLEAPELAPLRDRAHRIHELLSRQGTGNGVARVVAE